MKLVMKMLLNFNMERFQNWRLVFKKSKQVKKRML